MEKIPCQICGKEISRINPVCIECMNKANISKSTLETIQRLDTSLEVLAGAGVEPEENGELLQKMQKLEKER